MTKRTFVDSFTYRGIAQPLGCATPIMFGLFMTFLLFMITCASLFKSIIATGITATLKSIDPNVLFGLFFIAIWPSLGLALLANAYPNIKVYEEGLEIQFFWIFWLFVPWEDVLALHRYEPAKQIRIVVVRKLTLLHKLMGRALQGKLEPAFAILPSIDRYQELISIIKEKVNLEDD